MMKAPQLVFQLIGLWASVTLARVYSDRIYFETDFLPDGAPTTRTPWMHPAAPSASKFHQQHAPASSGAAHGEGFEQVQTKLDESPDLAIRTTVTEEPPTTTTMMPYVPGILDQAVNTLTLNMQTLLDKGSDNLVFSPLSIAGALTMLLLGAGGETLKELAAVLGVTAGVRYSPDGTDLIHEDIANYFRRFQTTATTPASLTRFANGVFLQADLPVSELYVRNVARLYQSEVHMVNFRPSGMLNTMNSINQWVSNRTEGNLKRILNEPLPADTSAVFINVIYFQGEWEHPFCTDCVKPRKFYVSPEETVIVNMMIGMAPALFTEDKAKGYKIVGLPYKSSDLAMYFILPKASPKEFLEGMHVNELTAMVQNATMQKEVIYIVPKMKLESTLDLVQPLKKMGLKSMFSPSADLRGVSEGIWVNSVLQKVEVEITETGTKAVVSTMISTTRSGHRPSVRLDRPFIFMVYHRTMRTILFWGTVHKPTPYETVAPSVQPSRH